MGRQEGPRNSEDVEDGRGRGRGREGEGEGGRGGGRGRGSLERVKDISMYMCTHV